MTLPRTLRSLFVSLALVATLIASTGCVRGGGRAALGALHIAAAVAEIAVVASILAHHDAHYHDHYCGHRYRYHEGRYNYWYNGHWEYYDAHGGVWYAY